MPPSVPVQAPKDSEGALKNARKLISSPSGSGLASKSLGESIKNAKKSSASPPAPGSPIIKRVQRATRSQGGDQVAGMNLSESQVLTLLMELLHLYILKYGDKHQ